MGIVLFGPAIALEGGELAFYSCKIGEKNNLNISQV